MTDKVSIVDRDEFAHEINLEEEISDFEEGDPRERIRDISERKHMLIGKFVTSKKFLFTLGGCFCCILTIFLIIILTKKTKVIYVEDGPEEPSEDPPVPVSTVPRANPLPKLFPPPPPPLRRRPRPVPMAPRAVPVRLNPPKAR